MSQANRKKTSEEEAFVLLLNQKLNQILNRIELKGNYSFINAFIFNHAQDLKVKKKYPQLFALFLCLAWSIFPAKIRK